MVTGQSGIKDVVCGLQLRLPIYDICSRQCQEAPVNPRQNVPLLSHPTTLSIVPACDLDEVGEFVVKVFGVDALRELRLVATDNQSGFISRVGIEVPNQYAHSPITNIDHRCNTIEEVIQLRGSHLRYYMYSYNNEIAMGTMSMKCSSTTWDHLLKPVVDKVVIEEGVRGRDDNATSCIG